MYNKKSYRNALLSFSVLTSAYLITPACAKITPQAEDTEQSSVESPKRLKSPLGDQVFDSADKEAPSSDRQDDQPQILDSTSTGASSQGQAEDTVLAPVSIVPDPAGKEAPSSERKDPPKRPARMQNIIQKAESMLVGQYRFDPTSANNIVEAFADGDDISDKLCKAFQNTPDQWLNPQEIIRVHDELARLINPNLRAGPEQQDQIERYVYELRKGSTPTDRRGHGSSSAESVRDSHIIRQAESMLIGRYRIDQASASAIAKALANGDDVSDMFFEAFKNTSGPWLNPQEITRAYDELTRLNPSLRVSPEQRNQMQRRIHEPQRRPNPTGRGSGSGSSSAGAVAGLAQSSLTPGNKQFRPGSTSADAVAHLTPGNKQPPRPYMQHVTQAVPMLVKRFGLNQDKVEAILNDAEDPFAPSFIEHLYDNVYAAFQAKTPDKQPDPQLVIQACHEMAMQYPGPIQNRMQELQRYAYESQRRAHEKK